MQKRALLTSWMIVVVLAACAPVPPPATPTARPAATLVPLAQLPQKIAFATTRDGNFEIYAMKPDGSDPVNLTRNPAADDQDPCWSPDGTRMAYTSVRYENAQTRYGNADIYVMNADGSNPVDLTRNPAFDAQPSWSPDGRRIAFVTDRDGNAEIAVMNADGSNVQRLTTAPGMDLQPAWSPDGTRIAFMSDRDGNSEVYVMNADGSQQVNLTQNPAVDQLPSWSPDGSQIAFSSNRRGITRTYLMAPDGSNQRDLASPLQGDDVTWSPDGTRIAFVSGRDSSNGAEIYVANADGSDAINVTNNSYVDESPAWSPQ